MVCKWESSPGVGLDNELALATWDEDEEDASGSGGYLPGPDTTVRVKEGTNIDKNTLTALERYLLTNS